MLKSFGQVRVTMLRSDMSYRSIFNTRHVATGRPNVYNMLRPTTLRYVAFSCCDHLAVAWNHQGWDMLCWNVVIVWPGHHVLRTRTWSFHVLVFQRTTKKCTENYKARVQPLFCSLNLLFSDVVAAVEVVVFSEREGAMALCMVSAPVSASRGPGSSNSQLSQISYKNW